MRILSILAFGLFLAGIASPAQAQTAVRVVRVRVNQVAPIAVYAGHNVTISSTDSIQLGFSATVNGGTPEYTYQWETPSGDTLIGLYHHVNGAGQYVLTVTDANSCSASNLMVVSVINTVNSMNIQKFCTITHSDSPNQIKVEFLGSQASSTITIYSIYGQVVRVMPLTNIQAGDVFTISLAGHKGLFLASVTCGTSVSTQKIILH